MRIINYSDHCCIFKLAANLFWRLSKMALVVLFFLVLIVGAFNEGFPA